MSEPADIGPVSVKPPDLANERDVPAEKIGDDTPVTASQSEADREVSSSSPEINHPSSDDPPDQALASDDTAVIAEPGEPRPVVSAETTEPTHEGNVPDSAETLESANEEELPDHPRSDNQQPAEKDTDDDPPEPDILSDDTQAIVEPHETSPVDPLDVGHPLAQDIVLEPSQWRIWPAVAVLRWVLRKAARSARRIVYRSQPTLKFSASEIEDVAIDADGVELILTTPGLAAPGSPLPTSDIARIIADSRNGGGLAIWLDGPGDCFMHALEAAQARNNAAFALATGGRIEALQATAQVVGRSAPLVARPGGVLSDIRRREPEGAVGLAGLFLGPISASGLTELFRAFTNLSTRVEEFTGAEVLTLKPARLGRELDLMLGSRAYLPSAGIEVFIDGKSRPEAQEWARNPARRRSLRLLARSYIGSPSPIVRLFLQLYPGNTPPAALDKNTALGGLIVLGKTELPVCLPLAG